MDRIVKYKEVIKSAILKHADFRETDREESEIQTIFDDQRGHYYLMDIGWEDMRRIHTCLIHLDLKNDKIWIQKDFTEEGIAIDLLKAGIPKDKIVLGFQAPFKRGFTEFAAA